MIQTAPLSLVQSVTFFIQTALATARVFTLKLASNTIQLLRSPLYPLFVLIGYYLAYKISGQTTVPQAQVLGFLVTGLIATAAWQAAVWGAGVALQFEMWSGTIGTILISPGPTSAVIIGYSLGNMIFLLPATVVTVIMGQILGATWSFDHPGAILIALLAIYVSTLCVGLAFSGLFILSRQANGLANFLQEPIHLLCGFYVSRELFPEWLQAVAGVIPIAHALDALRATALEGKSLSGTAEPLLLAAGTSLAFALVGIWSLRRLDRVVRRAGTLDLL
jgi:ABC-2 type transport system permease protein